MASVFFFLDFLPSKIIFVNTTDAASAMAANMILKVENPFYLQVQVQAQLSIVLFIQNHAKEQELNTINLPDPLRSGETLDEWIYIATECAEKSINKANTK